MGNSIVRGVKRETEARAVLVGLDFSGKTKILYWLKNQSPTELEICLGPTKGFNVETIQGNTKITIWDIGGNVNERCHWRHFYPSGRNNLAASVTQDSHKLRSSLQCAYW